jgi:hypothetical protein
MMRATSKAIRFIVKTGDRILESFKERRFGRLDQFGIALRSSILGGSGCLDCTAKASTDFLAAIWRAAHAQSRRNRRHNPFRILVEPQRVVQNAPSPERNSQARCRDC